LSKLFFAATIVHIDMHTCICSFAGLHLCSSSSAVSSLNQSHTICSIKIRFCSCLLFFEFGCLLMQSVDCKDSSLKQPHRQTMFVHSEDAILSPVSLICGQFGIAEVFRISRTTFICSFSI